MTLRRTLTAVGACLVTVALVAFSAPPAVAVGLSNQYWLNLLTVTKAWQTTKGAGVTVAVVDGGVDSLKDISGNLLPGVDLAGSGDGRSDAGDSCDSAGCFSHGTQMALEIAGTGKGSGFVGIAPEAKILPVKVIEKTGDAFPDSTAAAGIKYAVDHGAKIIDASFGSTDACSPTDAAAVKYAYQHDVIVVAAAGNEGFNSVETPASCPGALAVSAIQYASNETKAGVGITLWSKSDFGPEVSFAGTGTNMPQELTTGRLVCCGSGTSDAAAITSGAFALLRAHYPSMSARDIVTLALQTVHTGAGKQPDGTRIDDKIGYGEVLPTLALAQPLKSGFPNPIYDAFAKDLSGPTSTTPAPTSSAPTSATAPTSTAPSSGTAPSPPRANGASSSGSNTGLIIGIVVAAVVVIGLIALLLARRRRPQGPGGGYGPPPGGGYGPPSGRSGQSGPWT